MLAHGPLVEDRGVAASAVSPSKGDGLLCSSLSKALGALFFSPSLQLCGLGRSCLQKRMLQPSGGTFRRFLQVSSRIRKP